MTQPLIINSIVGVAGILAFLAIFYLSPVRKSRLWTITVTPLASIIGSGFLVAAPLLYENFGNLALPAMIVINLFAISVGEAIRTNIRHFDVLRDKLNGQAPHWAFLEHLSNLALGVSYIISIAFYIALLSGFALNSFHLYNGLGIRVLSTLVLAYIGWTGYRGGLHGMEKLEKVAVNLKMSIIGGLIVMLVAYNLEFDGRELVFPSPEIGWHSLRVLGGMLLITQGFETVKYLGAEYDPGPRVRAMWVAQIVAAVVYIIFVPLVAVLMPGVKIINETAIIEIVEKAAWGFGMILSAGAMFSQFGAAVADTVGTGGLLERETRGRLPEKRAYAIVTVIAILLIWAYDVFSVLTLASRAFAFYYGLQTLIAIGVMWHQPPSYGRTLRLVLFPILVVVLFFITIAAVPAHTGS